MLLTTEPSLAVAEEAEVAIHRLLVQAPEMLTE
jgi:hypothetical protein